MQSLVAFLGIAKKEDVDVLQGMELGGLCQQADAFGFWSLKALPGVNNAVFNNAREMADRFATPPNQIFGQQY